MRAIVSQPKDPLRGPSDGFSYVTGASERTYRYGRQEFVDCNGRSHLTGLVPTHAIRDNEHRERGPAFVFVVAASMSDVGAHAVTGHHAWGIPATVDTCR